MIAIGPKKNKTKNGKHGSFPFFIFGQVESPAWDKSLLFSRHSELPSELFSGSAPRKSRSSKAYCVPATSGRSRFRIFSETESRHCDGADWASTRRPLRDRKVASPPSERKSGRSGHVSAEAASPSAWPRFASVQIGRGESFAEFVEPVVATLPSESG
jgi:hypothetical protein